MSILDIILYIALFGFLVFLVLQIPLPQPFRNIIIGVVIFALVVWTLQSLGLVRGFPNLRLSR